MPSLRGSQGWFSALLLVVLQGCGSVHSDPMTGGSAGAAGKGTQGPTAGRAGDAAVSGKGGTEAGSGGGPDVSGMASPAGRPADEQPTETKFVVRNDGEDALILGSNCGAVWPSLFEGDNQLGLVNSCSCPCEDRSVCGCPAICLNTQELLVPGKSLSKTWGGTALDYSTDMTRSCFVERVPATGTKLEVRACWNYGDGGMPQTCSAEWFAYGRDTEVTISAKPSRATSKSTTIGLSNTSNAPIYVVKERCGAQDWFRLDMGEELTVNTFCSCDCNANFRPATCPTCGGCPEDVIEAIAPGAMIQFTWDSRFWYRYEGGCSKQYNMPAGTQVKVQLCWSKTPNGQPTCQPTFVDVGSSSVLSAG